MELVEAIEGRRSVRAYRAEEVPGEVLKEAIRLGNRAPSAGNLQARDFVLVRDINARRALARAAHGQNFLSEAPVVIVVCVNFQRIAKYGSRGKELYVFQDAASAITNIQLFAHSKGYATCWVGAFDETAVTELLGLPSHIRPVALIPFGKSGEHPAERGRLEVREILHDEKW